MNKIFKVIWSKVRNCYVAVSEIAKRNGKSCTSVNCGAKANRGHAGVALSAAVGATLLAGVCTVLLPVRVALAAPVMPTLDVNGKSAAVSIASTSSATSATMNISSTQTNNVLKWIDFSIEQGGTVQFDPNNYLNYVTGHGRSEIDGILKQTKNSGGQRGSIYIVNPNGVLFGDNARVDVGSLYVSTRKFTDNQLASLTYSSGTSALFQNDSAAVGDVINLGKLNADVIQVEGKNISFKNIADVTKGGTLTNGDITGGTPHYQLTDGSVTLAVNNVEEDPDNDVKENKGEIHLGFAVGVDGTINGSAAVDLEYSQDQYKDVTPPSLDGWTTTGTTHKYMLVRNPYELQNMQHNLTKENGAYMPGNYMLANDINFKNADDEWVIEHFQPIGSYGSASTPMDGVFQGRFDGLNYAINNIKIDSNNNAKNDSAKHSNIGIIGSNAGTIENLRVVDATVDASNIDCNGYLSDAVGGIVGANKANGIIRNVSFSGTVKGGSAVGGIAGYQNSAKESYPAGRIEKAYNTGTIEAVYKPDYSNSESSGSTVGGIVGKNYGVVSEVYNSGKVSGDGTGNDNNKNVGGIAGSSGYTSSISNAYNTGEVSGKKQVGGIAGVLEATTSSGGTINNTYNSGPITIINDSSYYGGIVGYKYDIATVSNSYFSNGNDNGYGEPKSETDLKTISTFEQWGDNISTDGGAGTIWRISEGQTMPQLTAFLKTKDYIDKKTYDGTADVGTTKSVDSEQKPVTTHQGLAEGFDYVQDVSVIEPKELIVTFADISKTYDGTTADLVASRAGTLEGVIEADKDYVSVTASAVYDEKNAGNRTVNYSGVTLSGTQAGNYSIADTATGAGTITPKTLSLVNVSKVYDGTAVVVNDNINITLTDVIAGDSDSITFDRSKVSGTYADKNAGEGKVVNYIANDGALIGAAAGNYIISATGTGDITAKTLNLVSVSKVYDGTRDVEAGDIRITVTDKVAGDDVNLVDGKVIGLYADKNVGDGKSVTYTVAAEGVLSGTDAGNYIISTAGTGDITKADLTLTTENVTKTYDGTTAVTGGTLKVYSGTLFAEDSISGGTFVFEDENAGANKKVYVSNATVTDGNSGGNYNVTYENNTTSTIMTKTLSVGNVTKEYDGTDKATLTVDNLIGLVGGDKTSLSISEGVTANYTGDKAADYETNGKTVYYSGLILGGDKKDNYSIAASGTSTTGNSITKRVLTANSVSKVYDGTPDATLHLSDLVGTDGLPGVVERDESALVLETGDAYYGNENRYKNAGNYSVTFSDISLTGDKAHNYKIIDDLTSINVAGTITPKTLELVADKKVIRVNEAMPSFTGKVIGFIDGEDLNSSDKLSFSLANPMTTPVVGSYRIVGKLNEAESGDYGLNYTFQNAASNATAFTVKPELAVLPALDFRGASVNVTIDKSVENVLSIDSTKPYNTLKWIDFSIGENGIVQFVDNNNYLNYVTGHGRSDIDGTITGGGAIYLINPNGVLFGSNANVDVGNLYVSSRTLDSTALNAFETDGTNPLSTTTDSAIGNIINRGTLNAAGITVEGNNVSFKNVEDVTVTGDGEKINVRADGEVHVGYAASEKVTEVDTTEYTAESVHRPDEAFEKWSVKKLNGTDNVDAEKYTEYMLVRNAYELQNMKNNLLGNYMLANDIEFKNDDGGYVIGQFIPIGSLGGWTDYREGMFKGKLDGLYHVIRDIYIDNTAITQNSNRLTDIGIIGSNAGIVENLGVINGNVNITNSGASAVGGIVGANKPGGIIRNVYFSGSVKGGRTGTGGVAGWQNVGGLTENAYATGTVTSCYTNGTPSSINGIIGSVGGVIRNAYFSGKVRTEEKNEFYTNSATGGGTFQNNISTEDMMKVATFNNNDNTNKKNWDISADGSQNTTWRIYEGKTTPLLTAFLKTKSLVTETEYNGYVQGFDQTLVTADSQVKEYSDSEAYYAEGTNADVYEGTKTFYSDSQQGYNIVDTKLVIQPKTLTLVNSKTYDGTENTKGTIGFTGKIDNDDVSLVDGSVTGGIYADKNVGVNKAVTYTIADSTLGGTKAANYILTVKGTGTITPIAITASFAEISKVYDGTINDVDGTGTAVASRTGTLTGVLEADTGKVSVTGKALYADKNAGTEKTVNYSNVALGGGETEDESGNYVLSSTSATGKGKIDKREISVVFGDISKIYDGLTTSDTIGARTFTNVIAADADKVDVTATATYDEKNAGSRTVSYTGITLTGTGAGNEAGNYSIADTGTGAGTIYKREISVAFGDINKTYDGLTTSDTIGERTFTNVIADDEGKVDVTATATYDKKNAGNRSVAYTTIALTGGETEDESGNYVLSSTSATGKGKIDKREISVVFGDISKIYDGLTTSDTIGARTFTNVIAADADKVDVTATATYDEKNAGSRTVSYTGITLTGTGAGNEAGNYSIADTGTGAGTIYKREISVAFGDINKTYDGLTTSDTIGERTFTNVIAADADKVDVTATATYDEKNVGSRTVDYSAIALTGDEANNYSLANTTASSTGTINKRETGVSFGAISKTYDGLTTSDTIGARTFTNVIAADADKVDVTATATYDKKNAGNRTVDYSAIALTGVEANNYSLTNTTASSTGTIDKKLVTATFADISKIYDGTTNTAPGAGTLTGVIAADEGKVNVSASAAYDEKNAGSRTVNYTGVTLSGAEAGNYSIATTATGNGTIGRKALELVADPASTEYGDYNPASFTGRVDGFVTGESVSNGDTLLFALSDPSASAVGSYGITGTINGSSSGDYGLNYTFTNAASNANAFTIYARPASVQDMVLSDIIPGIKGKSGADISVTALDNAMEQARDKRAEVGIEFAVAQTILSVDADRNLSLENRGMKQPPAMTPQEVAEQVHVQQGKGNGVAAQAGGNAGAASGGTNENGAASNAGVTGAVNAAMDVVQQTDDAVGTEESKRKKGVA